MLAIPVVILLTRPGPFVPPPRNWPIFVMDDEKEIWLSLDVDLVNCPSIFVEKDLTLRRVDRAR